MEEYLVAMCFVLKLTDKLIDVTRNVIALKKEINEKKDEKQDNK